MVGCVALFLYSLIGLGGLCPFCTLYYVASGLTLWMFVKQSEDFKPDFLVLGSFAVVFLIAGYLTKMNVDGRVQAQSSVANDFD